MSIRHTLAALVSGALLACVALMATPVTASAATGGCYGASCNGLDPSGRCDGDAITVASKDIVSGVIELRYSKSCAANWGRYTPYRLGAYWKTATGTGHAARVTAWNPGGTSYGAAHYEISIGGFDTSWSQMVDGTKTACTGVGITSSGVFQGYGSKPRIEANPEAVDGNPPIGWEDEVWNWGPCY